ncbi:MAG: class A beta-lactamase [Rhodanobacter sp.]|nr:class A beta-lactamase [Rhodanobacter sp.]
MKRRSLLRAVLMGTSAFVLRPAIAVAGRTGGASTRLAALERRYSGRLGAVILDTGNGRRITHRGDERFRMCSTFKLLLVAAVLARVDRGAERLDRRIVFSRDAVLDYAPVTRDRVGAAGMRVAELCRAAIALSDNTAANLLLASLGGPAAVTAFARGLGDPLTRLDRIEPFLNVGGPGDVRDTTTPNAMLDTLHKVLLGRVLSIASRALLEQWLRGCLTGSDDLRAGVPAGWTVGDKTGSGNGGIVNDIGILWPPRRKPLLVTAYYAGTSTDLATGHAAIAEVGRIAASI